MSNLVEVAKNRDEIMKDLTIRCQMCGVLQYSPYDKLFSEAYGGCIDCLVESDDFEKMTDNILAIVEA